MSEKHADPKLLNGNIVGMNAYSDKAFLFFLPKLTPCFLDSQLHSQTITLLRNQLSVTSLTSHNTLATETHIIIFSRVISLTLRDGDMSCHITVTVTVVPVTFGLPLQIRHQNYQILRCCLSLTLNVFFPPHFIYFILQPKYEGNEVCEVSLSV